MSPPRLIYLHGFASSPGSYKAVRFVARLRELGLEVALPDLNEGDFCGLTISRQLRLLERLCAEVPRREVVLLGSSMGAYVCSLHAARSEQVAALVLMAPAFDFIRRWTARLGPRAVTRWEQQGSMPVWHFQYEQELPIGYELVRDAATHPAFPDVAAPTLMFHGRADEVVEAACSEAYAAGRDNVELVLLDSDHGLGDVVDRIIGRSVRFLAPWIGGEMNKKQTKNKKC